MQNWTDSICIFVILKSNFDFVNGYICYSYECFSQNYHNFITLLFSLPPSPFSFYRSTSLAPPFMHSHVPSLSLYLSLEIGCVPYRNTLWRQWDIKCWGYNRNYSEICLHVAFWHRMKSNYYIIKRKLDEKQNYA